VTAAVATKRVRFVVRGVVQGVNFRHETVREAAARRLTGRVWNRDDGAVEVIAEGAPPALDDLARWLRRGSRLADVESVERSDIDGERRYRDFAVAYGPAS
jgi:acylphosphatase